MTIIEPTGESIQSEQRVDAHRLERQAMELYKLRAKLIDQMEAAGELDYAKLKELEDQAAALTAQIPAPQYEEENLVGDDVLALIQFDDFGKAQRFAWTHNCVNCLASLIVRGWVDYKLYHIACPTHGDLIWAQVCTVEDARRAMDDTLSGERDMRNQSTKPVSNTLEELGY